MTAKWLNCILGCLIMFNLILPTLIYEKSVILTLTVFCTNVPGDVDADEPKCLMFSINSSHQIISQMTVWHDSAYFFKTCAIFSRNWTLRKRESGKCCSLYVSTTLNYLKPQVGSCYSVMCLLVIGIFVYQSKTWWLELSLGIAWLQAAIDYLRSGTWCHDHDDWHICDAIAYMCDCMLMFLWAFPTSPPMITKKPNVSVIKIIVHGINKKCILYQNHVCIKCYVAIHEAKCNSWQLETNKPK